jgi:hypothetical protein
VEGLMVHNVYFNFEWSKRMEDNTEGTLLKPIEDQNLRALRNARNALFDILMEKEDIPIEPSAVLSQTADLSLTKAACQQGAVNIFQLQSVALHRITGHAVKVIKLLDNLIECCLIEMSTPQSQYALPKPEQAYIEATVIKIDEEEKIIESQVPIHYDEIITAFFEAMANKQLSLKALKSFVTDKYIATVQAMHQYTNTQVEKTLGLAKGYINQRNSKNRGEKHDSIGAN